VNRRDCLVAALGLAGMPALVRAQTGGRVVQIGWLDLSSAGENLGVFIQAMGARGWAEGKAFRLVYRGGEGKADRLAAVTMELVRMPVDAIVAPGVAETAAAKRATSTIPIVMAGVDDPVERGLVASLARPGGNVTGLAAARGELSGKLLSLVREIVPKAPSVALLADANDAGLRADRANYEAAARALGVAIVLLAVSRHSEVEPGLAAFRKQGGRLLVVIASSMLIPRSIADLALKYELALASTDPSYIYEGGLLAYAEDWNAVFERTAMFVDRVLKGARPADLPVELPTKFKLIVNAKTARALGGLVIPQSILVRADHVVE
jgi:putative ABC transport system substrate-binding protein